MIKEAVNLAPGLAISRMGFGTWPLAYDNRPSEEDAIKHLHYVFSRGITLLDTADAYAKNDTEAHYCERLIRKAIESYPGDTSKIVVATKGVMIRPNGEWKRDPTPAHLTQTIHDSHEALSGKAKPIALWQMHYCSPTNPPSSADDVEMPMGVLLRPAIAAMGEGVIDYIGLSNCTVEQIKEAREALPEGKLVSVQNRFNFWDRSSETNGVLEYCQANNLVFFPWSALGGKNNAGGAGLLRDAEVFPNLIRIAAEKSVSPEALALAWMQAKWPCIVHIVSSRSVPHFDDSLSSLDIKLSKEEVDAIDKDGPQ